MIKKDLIERVSRETGLVKSDVKDVVQGVLDCIVDGLQNGESVELRNFGVFELQTRKSRVGRNPKKPEDTVIIPARKVVKFKPGKVMKETITKKI